VLLDARTVRVRQPAARACMVIFGSITLSAVKYALDRRFITMESMDVMSSKVTPTMLWESLTIIGNTDLMEQT
jgi:hypothetical protein